MDLNPVSLSDNLLAEATTEHSETINAVARMASSNRRIWVSIAPGAPSLT